MIKFLIALMMAVTLPGFPLQAQVVELHDYDWTANRQIFELDASDLVKDELILKDKRSREFVYEDRLYEYLLVHKVIRVNSDEAIEFNNKVYIPLYNVVEVIEEKARVITSDGQVRELSKDAINEAKDESNGTQFRYFAFEGIDKGSEIEYLYKLKLMPRYRGVKEIFQTEVDRKNVSFEIISPINLIFETKSFNGFPEMKQDTIGKDKIRLHAESDLIEHLEPERMAAYEPNLQHIIYKLQANTSQGTKNLFSYNVAAEAIYNAVYAKPEKKQIKAIKKIIKSMKLPEDETLQIRAVEHFIKINYQMLESPQERLSDLDVILTEKLANEKGIVRLFALIFDQLGIAHEIVMTSNRFDNRFDPIFQSFSFLENYLFYFPDHNTFIAPAATLYRVGVLPYAWSSNYGLFIKKIKIGDFESAFGNVKFIEASTADDNGIDLIVQASYDDASDLLNLKMDRALKGHYAQSFQPLYDYLDEKDIELMNKLLFNYIDEDMEIKSLDVVNTGSKNLGLNPLMVKAEGSSKAFMEHAGKVLLFRIGDLIGPQSEMYQEEDRKLGIENDFNRRYKREIRFEIPEGYTLSNLEALSIDVFDETEEKRTMSFTSSYEIRDQTLIVQVNEFYSQIKYPVDRYEAFRKVINAAADFNKIVLLLQKK